MPQDRWRQAAEEHYPHLFRVAAAICGREKAWDVCQETFLGYFEALERGETIRNPRGWLLTVAVRAAQRSLRWQPFRLLPRRQPEPFPSPGAGEEQAAIAQAVRDALEKLPPRQRAALALCTLEGMPTPEAAAILECAEPTVRALLFQARSRLREILEREHPDLPGAEP